MTPCGGNGRNATTWCCGNGNQACCGTPQAITIALKLGPSSTSSATISSSPTASATSSTTSGSASPTNTDKVGALSVGAQAGIGVGVSLAGLAVLGIIIWFVMRRRRRREQVDGSGHDIYFQKPELDENNRSNWGERGAVNVNEPRRRHELDGLISHELDGFGPASEMPAR